MLGMKRSAQRHQYYLKNKKQFAKKMRIYYLKNRERIRLQTALYRAKLKSDPVAWAVFIEKARLYHRKKYGWERTYQKSLPPLKVDHE